jgi:hypothetical protein
MRPRPAAVSGSTGAQQRLRYGLGEFRPYHWRGRPGWNPAGALQGRRSRDRKTRPCGKCGTVAGEQCRTRAGGHTRTCHVGR